MKPKRIQRLVDTQTRVQRARRGFLAQAQAALRTAQAQHERVLLRGEAHARELSAVRDWEREAMPRAAEMVRMVMSEEEAARVQVQERAEAALAAAGALQEAAYELRRFELMLERARKAAQRVQNQREQATTDDITGTRGGSRDEGT